MAIQEESAGVVVFRAVEPRLYLLLDYGTHWDYPKGHIEAGETPLAAALRELKEETGIADAELVPDFAQQITYYFRQKKKGIVRKTVVFYLGFTKTETIKLSDEHVGFAFEPFENALRRLTFASARQVLRKAEAFLAEMKT